MALFDMQVLVGAAHRGAGIPNRPSHGVTEKRDQVVLDPMKIHANKELTEFGVSGDSLRKSLNGDLQRGQSADRIVKPAH